MKKVANCRIRFRGFKAENTLRRVTYKGEKQQISDK